MAANQLKNLRCTLQHAADIGLKMKGCHRRVGLAVLCLADKPPFVIELVAHPDVERTNVASAAN